MPLNVESTTWYVNLKVHPFQHYSEKCFQHSLSNNGEEKYQHEEPQHNNEIKQCTEEREREEQEEEGIEKEKEEDDDDEEEYEDNGDNLVSRGKIKTSPRLYIWHFLLELLNIKGLTGIICWTHEDELEFKIHDGQKVSLMWGQLHGRENMTYAKFSRALRYHYQRVLIKVAKSCL